MKAPLSTLKAYAENQKEKLIKAIKLRFKAISSEMCVLCVCVYVCVCVCIFECVCGGVWVRRASKLIKISKKKDNI